jgi:hypothetical protein
LVAAVASRGVQALIAAYLATLRDYTPLATMNPRIDSAIITEAYEDDPESAASKYGAEFRTDITDFIGRQVVDACVEAACHERPPAQAAGRRFSAFIDAAYGSGSDSMTVGIAYLEKDGVPVLDAIRERKPPFSPEDVVTEFVALMKGYGIHKAESDKWAAIGLERRSGGRRVGPVGAKGSPV